MWDRGNSPASPDRRSNPDHPGFDQQLARLARLIQVEAHRIFQVLEQRPNGGAVLFEERILADENIELFVEGQAVFRVENPRCRRLALQQGGARLRKLSTR